MAKKISPAQKAADTRARRNPLTGDEPNSFTAVTNRTLPDPVSVRPLSINKKSDPSAGRTPSGAPRRVAAPRADGVERRRLRQAHVSTEVGPSLGYEKPEGMSANDHAWLMGAHHMFPNEATGPAINEPHEGSNNVTVQRRAEDLSGHEYRKGEASLAHFGHDPENPLGSLVDTLHAQTRRVMAEHIRAGVEESSSQLFYGGTARTEIPSSPDLEDHHWAKTREAYAKFEEHSRSIATHPSFVEQTGHLTHPERMQAARDLVASATADTSPNAKWRTGEDKWPNLDQAHESVLAGLEKRNPKFITGRTPNEYKAADRTEQMVDSGNFDTHKYGDPKGAPKTIAFRGALSNRNSPDAFTVTDVHHASIAFPGLPTAKSKRYEDPSTGDVTNVYPDQPASATKGLEQRFKRVTRTATKARETVPDFGYSRPEQALAVAKPYTHALIDRGMRQVASDLGLSRGVNYADNVHQMQAAMWGSQQVRRPDVEVHHSDQYPVVRDWAGEGHDTLTDDGRALFGKRSGMGAQFVRNPNTTGVNRTGSNAQDIHRARPYDLDDK